MRIPTRELTPDDRELIEFARRVVDDNTDGEDGVHTMGAAVRGADGLAAIVAVGNNGRGPVGPTHLVATTKSSRRPSSHRPRISSDTPHPRESVRSA